MSLRLRLLLSLLALTAVGLLIVDAVSYGSLRSHLLQRVDQQVESARGPATVALLAQPSSKVIRKRLRDHGEARGFELRGHVGTGAIKGAGPVVVPAPGAGRPGSAIGLQAPGGATDEGPPGTGPPDVFQLPPGTYGAIRNARGKTVSRLSFSYGEQNLPAPTLPKNPPISTPVGPVRTFTVDALTGSAQFRAAAFRPAGSTFTAFVAVPLNDFQDTLNHVALIGAVVTAAVLIGLAMLAWWLIRLGLRPLEEMGETAGRIADGDLSQRVEETNPRTEVGQLGVALNSMLGQIEEAFDQREASEQRMRRFLADASHELRTPLTSIRGYAEVFGMGAAEKPEDVEMAMRRIEQESVRMTVMVNDLLSLARLDEVREPLRERVDLRELVSDACEDARAAAPDRRITFNAPDSAEILGDPHQLRQVVSNLLANATVHTPAGTPIEVALETDDDNVTLSIRDHGPGIADGAEDQIFERFWRQSTARGRESGGAGLGLAIVAGVVAAHGGHARASNHPEGGAVFTIELPIQVAEPAR
jgi:two-component system, OmpR family, sensor kinase